MPTVKKFYQLLSLDGNPICNNLIKLRFKTTTLTIRTNESGIFDMIARGGPSTVEVFEKGDSFFDAFKKTGQTFKCKIIDDNKLVLTKKVDTV